MSFPIVSVLVSAKGGFETIPKTYFRRYRQLRFFDVRRVVGMGTATKFSIL